MSINEICAKLVLNNNSQNSPTEETTKVGQCEGEEEEDIVVDEVLIEDNNHVLHDDDDDDCSLKSWGDNQMQFLLPHLRTVDDVAPAVVRPCVPPPPRPPPRIRAKRRFGHRPDSFQRVSGFMRFLTHDDCASELPADKMPCAHRRKRAHYHCMQEGCNRAYLLASEAHMHYNTHCKVALLARDGFARYKANEACPYALCVFRRGVDGGLRSTHFHCLRPRCNYAFKNKSDMEKHKGSHEREADLLKDGFRKIYKTQKCEFVGCSQGHIATHIHCLRRGCNHILMSSSQVMAHKRRHDKEGEEGGGDHKEGGMVVTSSAHLQHMPTLNVANANLHNGSQQGMATMEFLPKNGLPTNGAPQLTRMPPMSNVVPPPTVNQSPSSSRLENSNGHMSLLSSSSGSNTSSMTSLLSSLPASVLLQLMTANANRQPIVPPPPVLPYIQFDQSAHGCSSSGCVHGASATHYHCAVRHCFYSTTDRRMVLTHGEIFHATLDIPATIHVFDKHYACNVTACSLSCLCSHMHCTLCRTAFHKLNDAIVHKCSTAMDLTIREEGSRLPYTIDTQCGRPFCKLKRLSIHYHCKTCSMGFSNVARLLPHLQKHNTNKVGNCKTRTDDVKYGP